MFKNVTHLSSEELMLLRDAGLLWLAGGTNPAGCLRVGNFGVYDNLIQTKHWSDSCEPVYFFVKVEDDSPTIEDDPC